MAPVRLWGEACGAAVVVGVLVEAEELITLVVLDVPNTFVDVEDNWSGGVHSSIL
jgi:hypothetical protein